MTISQQPCVAAFRPSLPATRPSSHRRPSSMGRIGQVVLEPSLKVDGLAVRAQSVKQDVQFKISPPANTTVRQTSIDSIAKQAETPKSLKLTFSSLAGSAVTVQASRKDSCLAVQERLAAQLDLPPYRITMTTGSGLLLDGKTTLEEHDIFEDADLIFVIGEADRWRDMSRDSFIELVVARRLATRENLLRSLASKPVNFDERKFRQRYVPQLESIEQADELKRRHEEHRQRLRSSVAPEASAMLSKLGALGAVSAIQAKIIDVETAHTKTMEMARAMKEDAQRDLDEALPALHGAEQALNAISKADLQEVKSFARPPAVVMMVGEAMCILFGVTPNWESTKKLWNDPQILQKMLCYDKDYIDRNIIKKLDPFMLHHEFSPDVVGRVSLAARGMCMWVRAMHTYDRVAQVVIPKKVRLMEAQEDLVDAELELKLWRKQLEEVMTRVGPQEQS